MSMTKSLAVVVLSFFIVLNASIATSAPNKEINRMVYTLNGKLVNQDWEGFGELFAKYTGHGTRNKDLNLKSYGNKATTTMEPFKVFGGYLSHSVVKEDICGDRLARVLTIFYGKERVVLY